MINKLKKRILPILLSAAFAFCTIPVPADELSDGSSQTEIPTGSGHSDEAGEELCAAETASEDELYAAETPSEDDTELLEDGETDSEGLAYILGRPLTDEERAEQFARFENLEPIPVFTVDNTYHSAPLTAKAARNASLSRYDARDEGLVTAVKDQTIYSDCWAFTIASLMETSLLLQGKGTYDLSEEHLAYYLGHRENDPLGNTPDDRNNMSANYHGGGNTFLATVFLSTWSGMALDAKYPHPSEMSAGNAYDTVSYLEDAVFFSAYSVDSEASMTRSVNQVKELIASYKSVGVLLYLGATEFNFSNSYYNADTASLCNPSANGVNHAVTIVGWDDHYAKENFNSISNVTTDGAWIAKNSWGDHWGKDGYFYISYQDASLSSFLALTASNAPSWPNSYFYDGSSCLETMRIKNGCSIANVYEAKAGGDYGEILGAVMTGAAEDSVNYSLQVYVGLTDVSDPLSGTPAYQTPVAIRQAYAGMDYVTIPEVEIAPGTHFSVVITNTTGRTIKYYRETSRNYNWCSMDAGTQECQSFVYSVYLEKWLDLHSDTGYAAELDLGGKPSCARLKAYTRTAAYIPQVSASSDPVTMTVSQTWTPEITVSPASYASLGFLAVSDDRGVVSVLEDGSVTAVNPGTAEVSFWPRKAAGSDRFKVSVRFTVLPKAPAEVQVTQTAYNKVRISWTAVDGCDGYQVFRKEAGGTGKGRATLTGETRTVFTDTQNTSSRWYLKPGVTYTYYVRALKTVEGTTYKSNASPVGKIKVALDKTKVTARTFNTLYSSVTWKSVEGADGYLLCRRENGGAWKQIADVNAVTYKDTNVKSFVTYDYKVMPYRMILGEKFCGSDNYSGRVIGSAARQTIRQLNVKSDGIQIVWNKQKSCSGYKIYRKVKGGTYRCIATVADGNRNSFTDRKAQKGVTYQYYVMAYVTQVYGNVYSLYTEGPTAVRPKDAIS